MELLQSICLQYLNLPYVWGGKSPLIGLDCSGLASLILKAGGIVLPHIENAQGLYDFFIQPTNHVRQGAEPGALVFYGTPQKVHHVAVSLTRYTHIEAGGGGPTINSPQDAVMHDAYSRITPIRFNSDFLIALMPEYPDLTHP